MIKFCLRCMGHTNFYNVINCCIAFSQERKHDKRYFNPLFWVCMITFPLVQPTIMIQFLIILHSLSHMNPPLNINLIIFIFLIFYNITFGLSHPYRIDHKVWRPQKNKNTKKQVMKRCVCSNVQRRAYASRPIVWKDDMILKTLWIINLYEIINTWLFNLVTTRWNINWEVYNTTKMNHSRLT